MLSAFRKLLFYLALAGVLLAGAVAYAHTSAPDHKLTPAVPEPTGIESTSACAIELEWNQDEPGAYYHEYEGATGKSVGGEYLNSFKEEINYDFPPRKGSFSYTVKPLVSEQGYYFRIRAGNPDVKPGESVKSAWAEFNGGSSITTNSLPESPGAPILEMVASEEDGDIYQSIDLEFSTSTEFDDVYGGFSVFRSADGESFEYVDDVPGYDPGGDGNVFQDSNEGNGLYATTTYAYRIYAYDSDFACDSLFTDDNLETTEDNQRVFSDVSNEITLPGKPVNPDANFDGDDTIVFSWDMAGSVEEVDHYKVWYSTNENPGGDPEVTQDTSFSLTYPEFEWNTQYYFKVSACSSPDVCSLPSDVASEKVVVSLEKPSLSAGVVYVDASSGTGEVEGSWTAVDEAEGYRLFRATNSSMDGAELVKKEGFCRRFDYFCNISFNGKTEFEFGESLNLGSTYYYQVIAYGLKTTEGSNIVGLDLDLNYVMKGVAWTAESRDDGSGGEVPVGVGWVKFNSASEGGSGGSSIPYSVQVSSDGTVSGYAWAGDYGWLSFNESDLDGRKAEMDLASGNLSGWARFINVPDGINWDGWVSLSGSDYGVSLDTGSLDFSGAAWGGGDMAGWIVFGGSDCSECTVRAEAVVNTCQPQNLSAAARSSSDIRVEWENVDNDCSNGISLYRSPAGEPGASRSRFSEVATFSSGNYQSQVGTISYLDGGLGRDTEYAYFARESSILENESNIDSATTLKADYNLICQARSSEEINVFWNGDVISGYTVKLFGGETGNFQELYSTGSGSGSFTHDGLDPKTGYNYELRVYDSSGSRDTPVEPDDQPVFCTTAAVSSDMPTNLNVIPLGPHTLHVTWKDNAARPHDFRIERIKLTPDDPTNLSLNAGKNSVELNWKNTTNNDTFKGPFYHVIERAKNPNFTGSSFATSTGPGSTSYSDSVTDFTFVDNEVSKKTRYYYRVKACSYIKADVDGDGSIESDCSEYSSVENEKTAWEEKNWFGTIIEAVKSFFLSIQEKSEGMINKARFVFAAGIDMDEYFTQFRKNLLFKENPGVYDDGGLDHDSAYLYRVKAVFEDGSSAYSQTGAGKTLPPGNETPTTINVCTRNSFCEPVTGTETDGGNRNLQSQCSVNADCRDVGTFRTSFEETK